MATPYTRWEVFYQKLSLIFHAIVAITMLPFVWLLLNLDKKQPEEITQDPVVIALFLAVCASLTATGFLYKKKQIVEARYQHSLRLKLIVYQRILVVMYLLLEGAAIFSTMAFYLTANFLFVAMYVLVLFVFTLGRPHIQRTCGELMLSNEERTILSGDGIIPE